MRLSFWLIFYTLIFSVIGTYGWSCNTLYLAAIIALGIVMMSYGTYKLTVLSKQKKGTNIYTNITIDIGVFIIILTLFAILILLFGEFIDSC